MKTLLKRLLLHPQRTLDLEYQDGGDDFKILLCMRDPVLYRSMPSTHIKIAQLLASLQTLSCQQVCNKLLTTSNNLVDIIKLVTRLSQQVCYNHDITTLLQPGLVSLVTFLYHDRTGLVRTTL